MRVVTSGSMGLRTARRITHVFIMNVPTHSDMLFITDAAISIFPDLEAKRDIVWADGLVEGGGPIENSARDLTVVARLAERRVDRGRNFQRDRLDRREDADASRAQPDLRVQIDRVL